MKFSLYFALLIAILATSASLGGRRDTKSSLAAASRPSTFESRSNTSAMATSTTAIGRAHPWEDLVRELSRELTVEISRGGILKPASTNTRRLMPISLRCFSRPTATPKASLAC